MAMNETMNKQETIALEITKLFLKGDFPDGIKCTADKYSKVTESIMATYKAVLDAVEKSYPSKTHNPS